MPHPRTLRPDLDEGRMLLGWRVRSPRPETGLSGLTIRPQGHDGPLHPLSAAPDYPNAGSPVLLRGTEGGPGLPGTLRTREDCHEEAFIHHHRGRRACGNLDRGARDRAEPARDQMAPRSELAQEPGYAL